MYIQLRANQTTPSVNKHYENNVILRDQNLPLKCFQPLNMLIYFKEEFRSFQNFNIMSIGERTGKLLAVRDGGLKKSLPSGLS